jgi:hypothetical protein
MDRATLLKHDAARHVRVSHEQILQELRRKTKDRQSRERAKNLYCVVVCTAIIFLFVVVYISHEWLRASHPTVVKFPSPDSWPAPHATAIAFRAPTLHHLESTLAPKRTGRIKVHAQGGVCCLRLTFNNENGMRRSDTAASCDGPMPDAPYEKTTIAGLGDLLAALSRGSEQKGSHDLR